jgi:lysophospholipase L1-like esterase
MGDSITALWFLPKSNLGISGNTTTQMLNRFSRDIATREYKAVIILGGTNDVRTLSRPIEDEVRTASSNIEQMAAIAEQRNLAVVLCGIPPIRGQNARVETLNAAIASLAEKHQYRYVDYYAPMTGHPEYFKDGVHPNDHGYMVMQGTLTGVLPLNF